jgi:hypothetical protein
MIGRRRGRHSVVPHRRWFKTGTNHPERSAGVARAKIHQNLLMIKGSGWPSGRPGPSIDHEPVGKIAVRSVVLPGLVIDGLHFLDQRRCCSTE